jgi:hypothetical protein
MPKMHVNQINQVCVVVRDVREAMRQYWDTVGIGPWKLYSLDESWISEMTYRGEPAKFRILAALADLSNIQFELIQPVDGRTIYEEFLEQHGEGLHHLGMVVDDMDHEIKVTDANGIPVIQSGRIRVGGGGFAYLGTDDRLRTTFEFCGKGGGKLPDPIEVYP